jgi:DNA-directed RNA polymerase specialized sigma24 family protein
VLEEFYSPWEPTLAEVAERLGRSQATVHARRKKALAALRRRLKTAA